MNRWTVLDRETSCGYCSTHLPGGSAVLKLGPEGKLTRCRPCGERHAPYDATAIAAAERLAEADLERQAIRADALPTVTQLASRRHHPVRTFAKLADVADLFDPKKLQANDK